MMMRTMNPLRRLRQAMQVENSLAGRLAVEETKRCWFGKRTKTKRRAHRRTAKTASPTFHFWRGPTITLMAVHETAHVVYFMFRL